MSRTAHDPLQDELPLSSLAAHVRWPGRTTLYVWEFANEFNMSEQHVLNLIEDNELVAINIAKDVKGGTTPTGRTKARFYRVPVEARDAWIAKRRSDKAAS